MNTETALPIEPQGSQASEQQTQAGALDSTKVEGAESTEGEGEKAKPEKTAEQRELDRIRRGIDRKTRQLAETRAELEMLRRQSTQPHSRAVTEQGEGGTNAQAGDESMTLSRAELDKLINERAEKLAPAIRSQQAEMEHRNEVVKGLEKSWGKEKFDSYASDLDDALGGLSDNQKRPKPVVDAIFSADKAVIPSLIEYLADPDNADEAETLGGMSALQAGRAIAKLEAKLSAEKPQRSNAPAPIESLKGGGKTSNMPNPSDTRAWMKWANENDRKR